MRDNLRQSSEFKTVYEKGRRFEGSLMTAFVFHNGLASHRLGITVSRKTAPRAVDRNRSKRLLRETFRLRKPLIESLAGRYDWVLNGRRALLSADLSESIAEWEQIVARIARDENVLIKSSAASETSSNSFS